MHICYTVKYNVGNCNLGSSAEKSFKMSWKRREFHSAWGVVTVHSVIIAQCADAGLCQWLYRLEQGVSEQWMTMSVEWIVCVKWGRNFFVKKTEARWGFASIFIEIVSADRTGSALFVERQWMSFSCFTQRQRITADEYHDRNVFLCPLLSGTFIFIFAKLVTVEAFWQHSVIFLRDWMVFLVCVQLFRFPW